jgi:DNA repair protein SbcC/Rad50
MLNKLFKKTESPEPSPPVAASKPATPPPDPAPWQAKLQAALGDDELLLALAIETPILQIKEEAVAVIAGEEVLKRAEREFRTHDRRVHRLAKSRLEAAIAQREARGKADELIASAIQLGAEEHIPANRLVELDHAWQALPQALLSAEQRNVYVGITDALATRIRERGDAQLGARRWTHDAHMAAQALRASTLAFASGATPIDEFTESRRRAEESLAAMTGDSDAGDVIGAKEKLLATLAVASASATRLEFLRELTTAGTATSTSTTDATAAAERWKSLDGANDREIAHALNERFSAWQRGEREQRDATARESREHSKAEAASAKKAYAESIAALLDKGEAALANGQIADAAENVTAIEALESKQKNSPLEKKLQARLETLKSEIGRLKGWQHWGGGRAREDLVDEAEALAKEITNPKLSLKAHGDAIDAMRNRWKELDKLGGATNQSLWLRFDGALKTAFLPVGAMLDKQKLLRNENLASRNQLIATLDAVKLAEGEAAEVPDYRALARSLDHFQTEWKKLGPVEHTVPRKAKDALMTRMKAAMARLETPLNEARRVEQLKRETLIERAKALAADAVGPKGRDVVTKVRELQSEWQQHAKALPLARQAENALWTAFKTATDSIFTARDAAHAARDAEFKGNQTAREALIAKLNELTADTPASQLKRALSEVDSEWRKAGEAPRAVAAKLDQRYRTARDTVQQYTANSGKRVWYAVCDALTQKMALCEELESGKASRDDIQARWQTETTMPTVWSKALGARLSAHGSDTAESDDTDEEYDDDEPRAIDQALLQLESALNVDSPAAFANARRDLKLLAMKRAIEGRQSVAVTKADIEGWIAEVAATVDLDAVSRERWNKVLAALRENPLK